MDPKPIKVLVVEDDPLFVGLLQHYLYGLLSSCDINHADRVQQAMELVAAVPYEVALLDLGLLDSQGLETFTLIHQTAPAIPIIVLTGADDEQLAVEAIRQGAQDYLIKSLIDGKTLARSIRYAIERKRIEETLREREEFFRLISENVQDMIAVLDKDGTRLYNSPSYRHLFGDLVQLQGTNSFAEIHPDDRARIQEVFQETVATGIGQRAVFRFTLKNGSIRYIESQGSAIRDAHGATAKVVVVSRDITERVQQEDELLKTNRKLARSQKSLLKALTELQQSHEDLKSAQLHLIQAAKMESVGTLAAGVAHEVKNPLQILLLGVDFLASQIGEEQDGIHKVLGQMRIAVSRADDIVRGMLDFSTAHQLVLQDVSLNPVIEQALRLVRFQLNRRGINLEREFATELPAVSMDCNKMEQVFINLFLNAIQAMPKGGTLTVKTRVVEIQCLTLNQAGNRRRSALGESYVVAEILDTGCGIPSDQISKIFDPFFTTKPAGEGTGLGLTVVHNIIQLHGGNIDIRNRPEGGVKATLCLKTKTHDKT